MYLHKILKLFVNRKNKNNEENTKRSLPVDSSSSESYSQEKKSPSTQMKAGLVQQNDKAVQDSEGNFFTPSEHAHHHKIQELANRAYKESGASFYSDVFPELVESPRSSRHNIRIIISPSLKGDFYELCSANLNHLKVGDVLRVKENGIFNHLNSMFFDLGNLDDKVVYRDRLKVEEIFEATYAAPAFVKVEVVGSESLLIDCIEVNRSSNVKAHDGQHLLSVARDYRLKEHYGYKLRLIGDLNGYTAVMFFGDIETSANTINFAVNGHGTDDCLVLGTLPKGSLSKNTTAHMRPITDEYGRPHPYLSCLNLEFQLELIVDGGKIHLYIFDTEPVRSYRVNMHNQQKIHKKNTGACDYIRIENGKYRCSQSGEMFVSSWYFEKRHGVDLNDVDVLRAAQADGVQHDKKCRIESESARRIWGEYVYMYPERWLEQQSSILW
jgi:hypothetical protein